MYVSMRLPGQGLGLQCLHGEVIAHLCTVMPGDRSQGHGLSVGGVVKQSCRNSLSGSVLLLSFYLLTELTEIR